MRNKLTFPRQPSTERGFTLLASAVCSVVLIAAAGLAVDMGRMYITKNEAQSYADAAAVSAALQLRGTAYGLTLADAAVASSPNSWGFSTTAFGAAATASGAATVTEYSADGLTNWQTSAAANPATANFARVTATVNNLPLYLLPVLNLFGGGIGNLTTVKAYAVAGQVPRAPIVFPFAPVAHAINCGTPGLSDGKTGTGTIPAGMTLGTPCDATGNFGWQFGQDYSLKWTSSAVVGTAPTPLVAGTAKTPCAGDDAQQWINMSLNSQNPFDGGFDLNAYATGTGSSVVANEIQNDGLAPALYIGTLLNTKSGTANTLNQYFNDRAAGDNETPIVYQPSMIDTFGAGQGLVSPDGSVDIHDNATYHAYETGLLYSGRRKITVVVRSFWSDINGTALPTAQQNIAVGFAQFLLWPTGTYSGAGGSGTPWCATYIGSNVLYGANHGGVLSGGFSVSQVRLTQ